MYPEIVFIPFFIYICFYGNKPFENGQRVNGKLIKLQTKETNITMSAITMVQCRAIGTISRSIITIKIR